MFRLWGKIWKDNHMLRDTVVCDDSDDTRTHKIFHGLEEICYQMDLGNRSSVHRCNACFIQLQLQDVRVHSPARDSIFFGFCISFYDNIRFWNVLWIL